MKRKAIDRILIAGYALMGAVSLIAAGVCVVAPDMAEMLGLAVHNALESSLWLQVFSILLVVVMLAWSVRLIMMALQREGSAPSSSAAVQESVNGAVRVSVRAMETLVRRAVDQTDGVLESRIRINNHDDSVSVEIDTVVGIESHVPAVTAILQRNVKGIVEEFSGIAVREVTVLVTEIRDNAPPALPAPKDESAQTVVVVPEHVAQEEVPAGPEQPAGEEPAEAPAEAESAGQAAEDAGEEQEPETVAAAAPEEAQNPEENVQQPAAQA